MLFRENKNRIVKSGTQKNIQNLELLGKSTAGAFFPVNSRYKIPIANNGKSKHEGKYKFNV